MSAGFKKTVLGISLVSLISASMAIFSLVAITPKKAQADTISCATILVSGITGLISGALNAVFGVPVLDSSNLVQNTATSGFTWGSFIKDCVLKPLLDQLIRTLIRQFTASIVDWINGGFADSPKFVTNIGGFMADVADEAAGRYIVGLDPRFKILCSPFQLRIRAALGANYSLKRSRAFCTLSDIEQNVQKAFSGGNFSGNGGWDSWLKLTTRPENNIYGSYINAQADIDIQIAGARSIKLADASWGRGFLSYQKCDGQDAVDSAESKYADVIETYPADSPQETEAWLELKRAESLVSCHTVTPGSTIADNLSRTLQSTIYTTEMAQSIDAILGALMNQMIGQVFSATGLFSTPSNRSTYTSYLTKIAAQNFTADEASANTNKPTAFNGVGCDSFAKPTYIIEGTVVKVLSGDGYTWVPTNPPISATDFNDMKTYCAYAPANNAFTNSLNNYSSQSADQQNSLLQQILSSRDTASAISQVRLINLGPTSGAVATQSYTNTGGSGFPASNAIDFSSATYSSTEPDNPSWWEVKLTPPEYVTRVTIETFSSAFSLRKGANLVITDINGVGTTLPLPDGTSADVAINPPIQAKTLRINGVGYLLLRDVKLYRYLNPTVTAPATPVSVTAATQPTNWQTFLTVDAKATNVNPDTPINVTDATSNPNLKLIIAINKIDSSGATVIVADNTGTSASLSSVNLPVGTYKVTYKAIDSSVNPAFESTTVNRIINIK